MNLNFAPPITECPICQTKYRPEITQSECPHRSIKPLAYGPEHYQPCVACGDRSHTTSECPINNAAMDIHED